LRLRNAPGVSPEEVVVLLHCLFDGAVLRMFVDPEALEPARLAQAMLRLAFAYAEPGVYDDPRRPADDSSFDAMVEAADHLWATADVVTFEAVARAAGYTRESVEQLFGTLADLADSALRARVMPAGPMPPSENTALTLTYASGRLHRLSRTATELPAAID